MKLETQEAVALIQTRRRVVLIRVIGVGLGKWIDSRGILKQNRNVLGMDRL